jgi:ketosteroid isomerase-like protein
LVKEIDSNLGRNLVLSIQQNEQAIRRCVELYNKRTLEYVDTCFDEQAEWIELPMPGTPNGRQGKREFMCETSRQRLMLFPDRQMSIRNLCAQGDQVAVELDWWATAAATVASFRVGEAVRMRIASFFTLVDGLIVKQTDYCVSIQSEAANP